MSSTQVHERLCALVVGFLLSSGSAYAGQIHVPADFASLQVAIDNAVVGDVIIVDGGTHGPLVIDKALTIVGVDSNPPFIRT